MCFPRLFKIKLGSQNKLGGIKVVAVKSLSEYDCAPIGQKPLYT